MMPTFVAPSVGKDGCELIFQVTVTDDDGFTNTDQVLIKVNDEKVNITNSGGGGCFIQAMDH
jgi:hypothetical protein